MNNNEADGPLAAADRWLPGQQRALKDVCKQRRPGHRWALVVRGEFYTLDDDGLRHGIPEGVELMKGPLDIGTGKPTEEMVWMQNSEVQLKAYDLGPTSP